MRSDWEYGDRDGVDHTHNLSRLTPSHGNCIGMRRRSVISEDDGDLTIRQCVNGLLLPEENVVPSMPTDIIMSAISTSTRLNPCMRLEPGLFNVCFFVRISPNPRFEIA